MSWNRQKSQHTMHLQHAMSLDKVQYESPLDKFQGGVWYTNLDGVIYIYRTEQGLLAGIYTRKKGNDTIVGILHFADKLQGQWTESNAEGTFEFNFENLMKSSNRNLDGHYTIKGWGHKQYPWIGRLIEDQERAVTSSLMPFQMMWVHAFNAQKHGICSSMYTKDAVFIMYNHPKSGNHLVANGQVDIREWWKGVVESAGLRNMRATPIPGKTCVVNPNEVMVSYDAVQFDTPNPKVKFNGIIHCEQWVRKEGGAWMVQRDVTEQTFP